MFSVRQAREKDAEAIAHVHVQSWRTSYVGIVPDAYLNSLDELLRVKLWQEWLKGGALVLVAEREGRVVGFAHGGANREALEDCDAELYSIYLLRESQGRGIGTRLVRATAEELLERGFRSMALWVLERNPARNFYEKMGAHLAGSKVIEIGGAKLMEVAYAWEDLKDLARGS